ncbi:VIR protein [Plasmodium vivax]|uniref:VIR protein n=1 Tax=Plasmodium vivax TaxID=5855 RepID=A0A1G4E2N6_PLAVI|nr:VIR protein [Plasmodium vivax]
MTGDTYDIVKWKTEYPFLNEIWKFYDNLDETLSETDNGAYSRACENVSIYGEDRLNEQKNTCKRLFRNTFLLSDGGYSTEDFNKYCDILYIWLYFEIEKNNLNAQIINQIFQGSINAAQQKSRNQISCPYVSYHEILHEPEKLMKLSTFNKNAEKFQSVLMNKNDSSDCSCQKYVFDCVNIYNDMYGKYCSDEHSKYNTQLCEIAKQFGTLYTGYLFNKRNDISYELKPLSSTTTNHVVNCQTNIASVISTSTGERSSSVTSKTLNTALGTMAGIPPFLALIYKFTPVGTWFRSQNRKNISVFKNLDEDIEKELYYPRPENENINSSHARYNVAYEPV